MCYDQFDFMEQKNGKYEERKRNNWKEQNIHGNVTSDNEDFAERTATFIPEHKLL